MAGHAPRSRGRNSVRAAVDQVHLGETVVSVAGLTGHGRAQHGRFGTLLYQVNLADRRSPVAGVLQAVAQRARIVRMALASALP